MKIGHAWRWNIVVPVFVGALLFALAAFRTPDLREFVLQIAACSTLVLIAIALAHAITASLGWNLDNGKREDYQRILIAGRRQAIGAFLVLAGEMVALLATLAVILSGMILAVWVAT